MRIEKRKLMLFVSTAVAAVFAGLLYGYLRSLETPSRPAAVATSFVVAAKKDIPPRKRLTSDVLFLKEVPRSYVLTDEFASLSDVEGRVTRSEILMGEPIREGRLIARDELSSLSLELPPEKRAVTVKVNEVVGVAGFVKPGDRVDVMTTLPVGSKGEYLTSTVAEDVYVVGVSQDLTANEDKAAELASSVTLAVNPDMAARIVLAEETGIIRLVLRPQDGWLAGPARVSTSDLVGVEYAHHFREPVEQDQRDQVPSPPHQQATVTSRTSSAAGTPNTSQHVGEESGGREFTTVQVIRGTHVTDVMVRKEEDR